MSNQKIYKYPISINDYSTELSLPVGANPVLVQSFTTEKANIWFLFDTEETRIETRAFRAYKTGHVVPSSSKYIGTYLKRPFVWHVFEEFPDER